MLTGDFPLALPLGTILAGQYEIDGILGQGGFGITYRALDHKAAKSVAVKEFFPDSLAARTGGTEVSAFSGDRSESFEYGKSCFLQEAETLAQFIGNENIVRVISYFEENGTAYFVMDFIEGLSFEDYITQRGGRISYEEACRALVPIMEALQEVHRRGIIHRDVTPDNIFITKDGIPKLIDFGAARYSLGDKSQSLDVVLKHGFAPKEQYTRRGRQGPYTDVYSLGASFYFAITGKRPPDSIERMDEDNLIPPSARGIHIPYEAEEAILKALSLQPVDRFQSMEEFERALLGPRTLSKKSAETEGVDRTAKTVAVPRDENIVESVRKDNVSGAQNRQRERRAKAESRQRKRSQEGVSIRQKSGRQSSGRGSGINPALIIGAAAAVLILVIGIIVGIRLASGKASETEAFSAGEEANPSSDRSQEGLSVTKTSDSSLVVTLNHEKLGTIKDGDSELWLRFYYDFDRDGGYELISDQSRWHIHVIAENDELDGSEDIAEGGTTWTWKITDPGVIEGIEQCTYFEAILKDFKNDDNSGLFADGGFSVSEGTATTGTAVTGEAYDDSPDLTPDDLTFPEIIGNTTANLMNCCHFGPDGEFMESADNICMCLSRVGDVVYYLDNTAGGDMVISSHDISSGKEGPVDGLPWELFTADRLLLSKAYYFVHTYGDKKMYCVNRSDGSIKNFCDIEDPNLCTFYKGSFYYITEHDGGQQLNSNPAGELDAGDHTMISYSDPPEKVTLISAADDGIVYRMEGDIRVLGKYKWGDDGSFEDIRYEFDYDGDVEELVPFGSDIYFVGRHGDDDVRDIGKFDTGTQETAIIKSISSKYNLSINVNEVDGMRKIGYMCYPESESEGEPYCGWMNEDTGDLKKTDLRRYADE